MFNLKTLKITLLNFFVTLVNLRTPFKWSQLSTVLNKALLRSDAADLFIDKRLQ